jgi:hypothetical protein
VLQQFESIYTLQGNNLTIGHTQGHEDPTWGHSS